MSSVPVRYLPIFFLKDSTVTPIYSFFKASILSSRSLFPSWTPYFPSFRFAAWALFSVSFFRLSSIIGCFISILIGSINNLVPFFNFLPAELCFRETLLLVRLVLLWSFRSFPIAPGSRKLVTSFRVFKTRGVKTSIDLLDNPLLTRSTLVNHAHPVHTEVPRSEFRTSVSDEPIGNQRRSQKIFPTMVGEKRKQRKELARRSGMNEGREFKKETNYGRKEWKP